MRVRTWVRSGIVGACALLAVAACTPPPASEAYVVDTTADTVDANPGDGFCADAGGNCSLRAAVMEGNSNPNATEVRVTGGITYPLTLVGSGEDAAATGDIDLLERTYVRTVGGSGLAIIEAAPSDRHFDARAGNFHYLEGLELRGGDSAAGASVRIVTGLVGIEDTELIENSGTDSVIEQLGGTLWIEDSTLAENTTSTVITNTSGLARLYQTTIATQSPVAIQVDSQLQLLSSTVTGPGTAIDTTATATVSTSVLDAPTACVIAGAGSVADGGGNVASDATCGLGGTSTQNVAAELAALADNGGPVRTRLPLPASPARDHIVSGAAGCQSPVKPDARQEPRPANTDCDAGAVEVHFGADCTVPPTIGPGSDLRGCDLTGSGLHFANLSGANLLGADLSSVTATSVTLSNANLTSSQLSGAVLSGANLLNADFEAAVLGEANVANALVSNADFTAATLSNVRSGALAGSPSALPADWALVLGYLTGPEADLDGANLSGADLSFRNLSGATFFSADLSNTSFQSADLSGATLDSADLTNAFFSDANLADASLVNVNLAFAIFGNADLSGATILGNAPPLSTVSFSGADLTGASLGGSYGDLFLSAATLDGATVNAIPDVLTLENASLVGATLDGSNFNFSASSSVFGSDFTDASLVGVSIRGILDFATFTGADLTDFRGESTFGVPTGVSLPTDWSVVGNYLAGPSANLAAADFSGLDLTAVDLSSTSLQFANLSSATLIFADLSDANLQNANLDSANATSALFLGANLVNADLAAADLSFANLAGADLANVDLTSTLLGSANLVGVASGGVTGAPSSLPTDWSLTNGYLVGPQAVVTSATLSSQNFNNRDLSGIDFTSTNLKSSSLVNTTLVGANLNSTNMTGTNLTGADLTGSSRLGVTWSNTTCPDGTNSNANLGTCEGHL